MRARGIKLRLISFGHKHAAPPRADLVFDARVLANPYWDEQLRDYSGLEPQVAAYVLETPLAKEFMRRHLALLGLLIENTSPDQRPLIEVGIGCTGGRHRSVAVAEALAQELSGVTEIEVVHRDINKV